jgi:glycerophosphoryl diester phosphodiesterase
LLLNNYYCSVFMFSMMKKGCFLLLILLKMSSGLLAQQPYPKFDIQGHRGARGLFPENTIPAFIKALELSVTTIELDVVVTKDKKVVVSHEPWMSAGICSDPKGNPVPEKEEKKYNIYQLTYEEVKQFDCGSRGNAKFPTQIKQKSVKPLLLDVILAVEEFIRNNSSYEVDYNIEIKSSPEDEKNKFQPSVEEFSKLVYEVVDQYLPMERVIIQSFDFRVLKYWHEKYPEVRLASLVENTKTIDANLKDLGFNPTIYSPYFRLLTKGKVDYLHGKKIRVVPWTVNEESDMLSAKGMGVDGLITDYPDRAKKFRMTFSIQRK